MKSRRILVHEGEVEQRRKLRIFFQKIIMYVQRRKGMEKKRDGQKMTKDEKGARRRK